MGLTKTQILPFLLILVIAFGLYILISISNNTLPYFKSAQFVTQFSPYTQGDYRAPNLNKDKTVTFFYPESRIESVESKNFLFKSYVTLTLRARIGTGYATQTTIIDIPANLRSVGISSLLPQDLNADVDRFIGINVTYDSMKNLYSFYDLKSWEINSLK